MSNRSVTARDFEVMVTLVPGPRHGYAIMQELRDSGTGQTVLGPGTLYRVLKSLVGRGLIVAVESTDLERGAGPPRRLYRLSAAGQRAVSAEARRLAELVERARPLLRSPAGRGYIPGM